MTEVWLPLGRFVAKLVSGSGPPWSLMMWNTTSGAWESVGQPPLGVLYEYGPGGPEFVLTAEGNVIGVRE